MLDQKCANEKGMCTYRPGQRHTSCTGHVARMAAVYPMALCKAIIQGCRNQLREDGRVFIGTVGILPHACDDWSGEKLKRKTERLLHVHVEKDEKLIDSVTGQPLIPELVKEARRSEMEYFVKMGVWTRRSRSEAFRRCGKPPISVRWIDTNKGEIGRAHV